jgi:ribose transport system substrate-binding protein
MFKSSTVAAAALILAVGCGSGGSSDTRTTTATTTSTNTTTSTTTKPDAGTTTPGSAFIPKNIEAVVDSLVAAAAATKADPNKTPVEIMLKETSGYFAPIVVGANRITSKIGAPSNVEAALVPTTGTEAEINKAKTENQNALLQKYIDDSTYKALCISPHTTEEVSVNTLNQFIATRGPAVTIDSDSPKSNRSYYIGTDNYQAGVAAAKELRKVLNAGDTIAVFGTIEKGWESGYIRATGAEEGAAAEGLTVAPRIPVVWNGDTDKAAIVTALSDTTLNIKGLICCYSNSFRCADAVDTLGLKGQVQIVGFDFTSDTKPWFDKGLFHAIAAQRQYYMGVLGALVPYAIQVIGKDATAAALQPLLVSPQIIDTGLDIVTVEMYNDYMAYLSALGVNN